MTTAVNDIRSDLVSIVSEIKGAELRPDEHAKSLKELGVDSLDMANILLAVEEKYDIKIPDADVEGLGSLESIVSYVHSRIPAGK